MLHTSHSRLLHGALEEMQEARLDATSLRTRRGRQCVAIGFGRAPAPASAQRSALALHAGPSGHGTVRRRPRWTARLPGVQALPAPHPHRAPAMRQSARRRTVGSVGNPGRAGRPPLAMMRNSQVELCHLDSEHDLRLLQLVRAEALPQLTLPAEELTAI